MASKVDQKIEIWKNRLLDLGKRNRLINYRETKRSTLTITKPNAFSLWESFVQSDESIIFPFFREPQKDNENDENESYSFESPQNADESSKRREDKEKDSLPGNVTTNQISEELQRTLRNLRSKAKLALEEQGINILYLAFGFLKWKEADYSKEQLASPLILVPVSLTVESISSPFVLQKTDDEIVVNPALKFKLENDFGIILPDFEEDDFDLESFLNTIQEKIKNNNWKVSQEVGLSLFSFLKINMYSDLERNKEQIVSNPIVRAIAGERSLRRDIPDQSDDFDYDKEIEPEETFQILDADSSQQDAILYAKKGVSFVLQGPPGTGKSQTIANIITELLAEGKKVLFVAEKMAALDVVYKRLSSAQLQDFCLVLHSRKANKKDVLEQLRTTLSLAEKRCKINYDVLDNLEELYLQRERLNQYAKQIFVPVPPLKRTIYEVNGILANLNEYDDVIFNIENIGNADSERYNQFLVVLKEYIGALEETTCDVNNNPWRNSNIQFLTNKLRHDLQVRLPLTASKLTELANVAQAIISSTNLDFDCSWQGLKETAELLAIAQNSPRIPSYWIKSILVEDSSLPRIPKYWKIRDDITPLFEEISEYEEKTSTFDDKVSELQKTYFEINSLGICNLSLRRSDEINTSEALDSEQNVLEQSVERDPVLSRIANTPDIYSLLKERQKAEEQIRKYNKAKEDIASQFNDDIYKIDSQGILSRYRQSYLSFEDKIPQLFHSGTIRFQPSVSFPLIPDKWLWEDTTEIRNNVQICEKQRNLFYAKTEELKELLKSLIHYKAFDIPSYDQLATIEGLKNLQYRLKLLAVRSPSMLRINKGKLFDYCRKEIDIAQKKSEEIRELKTKLLEDFEKDVLSLDYETILNDHILDSKSSWKFFIRRYHANRRQMTLLYKKVDQKIDDATIISTLKTLKEIDCITSDIDHECGHLITAFDSTFQYENTNFQTINDELIAYEIINKTYRTVNEALELLLKLDPKNEKLIFQYGSWYKGLETSWEHIRLALDWVVEFRKQICKDKELLQSFLKNKEKVIHEQSLFNTLLTLEKVREEREQYRSQFAQFISVFDNLFAYENTDFHLIDKHFKTYRAIESGKAILEEIKNVITEFVSNEQVLKNHYDFLYERTSTSWSDIRKALDWTVKFKEAILQYSPNEEFIKLICSDSAIIDVCKKYADQLPNMLQELELDFQWFTELFDKSSNYKQTDLRKLSADIRQYSKNLSLLEEWISYNKARKACEEKGLGEYVQQIEKLKIIPEHIIPAFKKRFFRLWLDEVLPQYPAVMNFRRRRQEETIRQFSKLDKLQLEIAKARVKNILVNDLPLPYKLSSGGGEIDVLRRELGKQRRIMPIRKLFRQIPNLLLSLKPCMMMSPLSVSLFLESDSYEFDAVIFDEASQICTENAIGAIARGKQAIIAGDSKQLPPTNFFSMSASDNDDYDTDEEEDEDDSGAFESILDEAHQLPVKTLLWHYRSRHEHLIAFSNAKFYHNELVTFPSLIDRFPDNGVEYVYVKEGIYDRGGKKGNIIEAKRVADLVFKHFKAYPTRSLGVIAFGETQQQAIETAIREKRMRYPQYEEFFNEEKEEPFFVKNLENVQGDERDTIIFSIGYAKDSKGSFHMNFGPLSKIGGERRLNVAITRAKYNVKLVGSILPTDIDFNRITSEGPKLLRSYIEFAQNGIDALQREITESEIVQHDSPFEKEVYDFLLQRGYNVSTQVGCSGYRIDMAVKHPMISGRYVIGIECDGATYHSARTARERDRLRQDILEGMGWKLFRIWSTDWIKDPETEGNRLIEAVENALKNYEDQITVPDSVEVEVEDLISLEERVDSSEDANNPYNFEEEREIFTSNLPAKTSKAYISEFIAEVVNKRYPIHYDLICKMVADQIEMKRVTEKVREEVDKRLRQLKGRVTRKGKFFSPFGITSISPRVNTRKDINHISTEELAEAMYVVLSKHVGLNRKQLCVETARAYNFFRMTANVTYAMDEAFKLLLERQRIEIIDNKVKIAN